VTLPAFGLPASCWALPSARYAVSPSLRLPVAALLIAAAACGRAQTSGQEGVEADPDVVADGPAAGDETARSSASPADIISCAGLHDRILRVPPTRAAFLAEYGPPDSVTASIEANRHVPDAVDSLFVVFYPGLVINIRTPQAGRDMATGVTIQDNRYLAYPDIGMETPAVRVTATLGQPTRRRDDLLIYDCDTVVEQPVAFRIVDGRVDRIDISYYVD
jgi:hypothetical protein